MRDERATIPAVSYRPDDTVRSRVRVLAVFPPLAVALLAVGEVLTPKGLDKPISDVSGALKALSIATAHSGRLYFSNVLVIVGLAALGVSFASIAALVRGRGASIATIAAVLGGLAGLAGAIANMLVGFNLAAAATSGVSPADAAHVLVSADKSALGVGILIVYLGCGLVAALLAAVALFRSGSVPRWVPPLFVVGLVMAAASSPGLSALALMLPFAVAMFTLTVRIWGSTR